MRSRTFSLRYRDHRDRPDARRFYNEQLFTEVAPRYQFVTRALSLCRDARWKRRLVAALPLCQQPVCVDLACGTGDIALLLAEKYPRGTVLGLDLTESMLAIARRRRQLSNVRYLQRDMCQTELEDSSVDLVTGGYALRNAPDLDAALREIRRILRPGGVVGLLDFSKPPAGLVQRLQYGVLKCWGSFWGLALHGNPEVYAYIAESLRMFPDRQQLRRRLAAHGLPVAASRRFYGGITELLVLQG